MRGDQVPGAGLPALFTFNFTLPLDVVAGRRPGHRLRRSREKLCNQVYLSLDGIVSRYGITNTHHLSLADGPGDHVPALHSPHILGKDQVVDEWATLIGDAQGRDENIIQDTEQFITRTKAPDVVMNRESVSPGLIRGMLGGKRYFLIISNTTNANLKPYKMYINARDYGTNLQISWYLVHQPDFREKLAIILLCIPCPGPYLPARLSPWSACPG